MTITIQKILESAFKKLGILGKGEVLSAEDANDAKLALNLMLASWSIRNVAILVTAKDSLTLVAGQREYTIGPDVLADFNTGRPKWIMYASLFDSQTQLFTPVEVIGEEQYLLYGDRETTQGKSQRIFYEADLPLGRFALYYIPDRPYRLDISSQKAFAEMTDLDAEFDLDEAYLEAIIYNLAVRMAPDFGTQPSQTVLEAANALYDALLGYAAVDMTVMLDISVRRPRSQTIYTGFDL